MDECPYVEVLLVGTHLKNELGDVRSATPARGRPHLVATLGAQEERLLGNVVHRADFRPVLHAGDAVAVESV